MLLAMPSFTFLHAADLHLDSPLRGLDPSAPTARIRGATRAALVNMVDLAIEQRVAFVVLAGDLFDGDSRDWRTGLVLAEQLGRLTRAGIEIAAISGNHDADQVLSHKLPMPWLLSADQPETRLLRTVPVAVHGQGFHTREVLTNLTRAYPPAQDGLFNIGLLHTACGSGEHANYAPCSIDDLLRLGYDYWALGHVHVRQELSQTPWIVFPGNLQGRHIKEEGAKGVSLVTVRDGRVESVRHHAVDVLRWLRLPVDVTGATSPDRAYTRVSVALQEAMLHTEGRMLAVRVVLIGTCPAHADLVRSPAQTLAHIRGIATEAGTTEELWIEDVRIGTAPQLDLEALRGQGGAVGAVIDALDQPASADDGLRAFAADQVRRADSALDPDHPVRAIAAGAIPADIVARARALLLAELAR